MINLLDLETKYGLNIVKTKLAKTSSEAASFASSIGYPVVLKIDSLDILHKSDIGGVYLNLTNKTEIEDAYENIINIVKANCPSARVNGVLVQEMLKEGFEIIIGYNKDMVFGDMIMLGMGGIFTEAFKDTAFRILPLSEVDASEMIDSLNFSNILLSGYRNIPEVSKDMLIDILIKTSKMAQDLSGFTSSFDINPVVVWGNNYRVIDFKAVESKLFIKSKNILPDITGLDKYFIPKSVAVIGASEDKSKIGNIVFDSIANHGYAGRLYPVNPKYSSVMGFACYPSILDIKDDIDLVVITVSLNLVPELLKQCRAKNVTNMIIISSGGKETGNISLEENIKKIAKEYGIRIIGCNCIGVFDGYTRIDTLFQPYDLMPRPPAGNISFITQSGTVGIAYLEQLGSYGLSKFISYGNRIDVDEGDLINYLANDSKTRVIAVYIEGLEKGAKFFNAAKDASKIKPVVVYKAGRSDIALKAATSHTGFLSGTYSVYKGIMQQAGIVDTDSMESLLASSKVLSKLERVKGNKTILITNGAGAMIQAIDRIAAKGKLKLTGLTEESANKLRKNLPDNFIVGNPIDLTGSGTEEDYKMVLETCFKDPNIDIIMIWFVFQLRQITEKISKILKEFFVLNKKPVIAGSFNGIQTQKIGPLIEGEGIPIFYSVEEWVSAAEAVTYRR
ncbi:MAG: acetate--CoA ligase family protein [Candidatus Humimicrobiaceae bacterium]